MSFWLNSLQCLILKISFLVSKNKSPTKSPIKLTTEESPKKSPRKYSPSKTLVEEEAKQIGKENGDVGISNVKSKLQRLGKLYSGKHECVNTHTVPLKLVSDTITLCLYMASVVQVHNGTILI